MGVSTESIRRDIRKPIERVGCEAYLSADQSDLASGVWTKVSLNTVMYDLGLNFNTTLFKFVIPVTGLYALHGKIDFGNVIANKAYAVGIYVNGVLTIHNYAHIGSATDEVDSYVAHDVYLEKDDYVELYALSLAGVDTVDIGGGMYHTLLGVRLITKEGIRQ